MGRGDMTLINWEEGFNKQVGECVSNKRVGVNVYQING